MTPILFDTNQVPYQEEKFLNFLEADEDEIDAGNEPEITLCVRKYPKRYFISWEVDDYADLPYDPIDYEDASRCYIPPRVYLWTERYLHQEFEQRKEQILAEIKSSLQQRYSQHNQLEIT